MINLDSKITKYLQHHNLDSQAQKIYDNIILIKMLDQIASDNAMTI